jgi:hypothetical protein
VTLNPRKRIALLLLVLAVVLGRAGAIDLSVLLGGGMTFPFYVLPELALAGLQTYDPGMSLSLNADVEFLSGFFAGGEFAYGTQQPFKVTSTTSLLLYGGLSAGYYFSPFSRMKVLLGLGGGGYYTDPRIELDDERKRYSDLYARARLMTEIRISPEWGITPYVGYMYELKKWETWYHGLNVGVGASFTLDLAKSRQEIVVDIAQAEPVFPIVYGSYAGSPIGTIKVTNREKTEIRDVKVEFKSTRFTSSASACGSEPVIRKGMSAEFPMFANFNEAILDFTEAGEIPGEITVSYRMLGSPRRQAKTQSVKIHSRNTLRWNDPAVISALASPMSPELLSYAKHIVGIARNGLKTGLNRNMQFAMNLFEGIRLSGVVQTEDLTTPYAKAHVDAVGLDYVQYPFQTLSYKSGDKDDIGLLFASCLESIGVRAAFIPLKDDFLICVGLGMGEAEAEKLFSNKGSYLSIENETWLPLSMGKLREGFINAWYAALDELAADSAPGAGGQPDFVLFEEAWAMYPPVGVQATGAEFQKPAEAQLARSVENALIRYISAELGPKIRETQAAIRAKGGTPSLLNQLGLLYVRAGMYEDAKAEFAKSAALNTLSAHINLGNIAMIERDYEEAMGFYKKALELSPANKTAQAALARAVEAAGL